MHCNHQKLQIVSKIEVRLKFRIRLCKNQGGMSKCLSELNKLVNLVAIRVHDSLIGYFLPRHRCAGNEVYSSWLKSTSVKHSLKPTTIV